MIRKIWNTHISATKWNKFQCEKSSIFIQNEKIERESRVHLSLTSYRARENIREKRKLFVHFLFINRTSRYKNTERNKMMVNFSRMKDANSVQSLSLITTGKFCIILFGLAFDYFTFKWKYFFIDMISGFSSFEWCNLIFFPTCYHGEISGIRSSSPPVVTKVKNPDNNFKQNCWP